MAIITLVPQSPCNLGLIEQPPIILDIDIVPTETGTTNGLVQISQEQDNIIEQNPDGIYATVGADIDFLSSYILASN